MINGLGVVKHSNSSISKASSNASRQSFTGYQEDLMVQQETKRNSLLPIQDYFNSTRIYSPEQRHTLTKFKSNRAIDGNESNQNEIVQEINEGLNNEHTQPLLNQYDENNNAIRLPCQLCKVVHRL